MHYHLSCLHHHGTEGSSEPSAYSDALETYVCEESGLLSVVVFGGVEHVDPASEFFFKLFM